MKHKKFVKQFMSMGHSRNDAEEMAEFSRSQGETYAHGVERMRAIVRVVNALCDSQEGGNTNEQPCGNLD